MSNGMNDEDEVDEDEVVELFRNTKLDDGGVLSRQAQTAAERRLVVEAERQRELAAAAERQRELAAAAAAAERRQNIKKVKELISKHELPSNAEKLYNRLHGNMDNINSYLIETAREHRKDQIIASKSAKKTGVQKAGRHRSRRSTRNRRHSKKRVHHTRRKHTRRHHHHSRHRHHRR